MKIRNPYFDNAKILLMFLVATGHFTGCLGIDNKYTNAFVMLFYFFHMPAYALLSGYFAKNITDKFQLKSIRYLIYYTVFELCQLPIYIGRAAFFLTPFGSMWYLFSLISWTLILFLFIKLKQVIPKWKRLAGHEVFIVMTVAVLIGAASGYFKNIGDYLGLSRTFAFLPFFLFGYYMQEKDFSLVPGKIAKPVSAAVLTAVYILIIKSVFVVPWPWVYGDSSYASMGHPEWYAGAYRIGIYAITAVTGFCFFQLVPRKNKFFTYLGENTLNSYLLHVFVALWFAQTGLYDSLGNIWGNTVLLLLIIASVVFFSSNTVNRIMQFFFNPAIRLLTAPFSGKTLHKNKKKYPKQNYEHY